MKLEEGIKEAYEAQVDLIRRGLPTRIVQSEFVWAINYFLNIDKSFKSEKLGDACLDADTWDLVFDHAYRAKNAVKYLDDIKLASDTINFQSFTEHPKLPKLKDLPKDLVKSMWSTCLVRLQMVPRKTFSAHQFPFPTNIDVLHDPERNKACQQYNKFSRGKDRSRDPDAKSILIALTIMSVSLHHRGGNVRSISQMLAHFVGFVFNGVRCLREEGTGIKIPAELVEAYSRNIAMISCSVINEEAGEESNQKLLNLRSEMKSGPFFRTTVGGTFSMQGSLQNQKLR